MTPVESLTNTAVALYYKCFEYLLQVVAKVLHFELGDLVCKVECPGIIKDPLICTYKKDMDAKNSQNVHAISKVFYAREINP